MSAIIQTHNLARRYHMGGELIHALRGIDLSIDHGEYVAIMGPSGSGKSTLMNLIGCLDSPDEGEYWLNGTEVSTMDDGDLAEVRNRQIGFVFQTFNLLPRLSALENVALPLVYAGYGREERLDKARRVLEAVGLGDRVLHKPNELSGGQRQRVAVARALVNDPAIILADEPTGNLDPATSDLVFGALQDLIRNEGAAGLIATHNHDLARRADRIVTLKDGLVQPLEL